jgi:fluoroacetyl-CoA thioesterase
MATIARLEAGFTHQASYEVTRDMRPPHLDGILATSRMIGLIEDACLAAIDPFIERSQTTVGTHVDLTHVAAARIGETILISVRLVKVTGGRLLTFDVVVNASAGVIGTGMHQRMVVDRCQFV